MYSASELTAKGFISVVKVEWPDAVALAKKASKR